MKYRGEIDGLRAISISGVLFFLAGAGLVSGGFLGVDVFFVISGYLITQMLLESLGRGELNILGFFQRRALRIFPALFFMIFACIPFAWFWMKPSQLEDFSASLVATTIFASNFFFFTSEGYFDVGGGRSPLLHTWSLAIEEQFYLMFPFFLLGVWRFGEKTVFFIIIGMTLIGLLLSEWGARSMASANFYLLPTRAWELLAGSMCAFIVRKQGIRKNNVLSAAG